MSSGPFRYAAALLAAMLLPGCDPGDADAPTAPYIPSPDGVVAELLELADVGPDDHVIDLGSGDGRIVLTAAKVFGASGMGVEIRPDLVELSNNAAREQGVADRVEFVVQDLFDTDISPASVLTMYLLPEMVNRLGTRCSASWNQAHGCCPTTIRWRAGIMSDWCRCSATTRFR